MYQLFCDKTEMSRGPIFSESVEEDWASRGKGQRLFLKLRKSLSRTSEFDRRLLLYIAGKMTETKRQVRRRVEWPKGI